jgi:hypothetical protein
MTQTLTVRLPQRLVSQVRYKARANRTNVSAVARRLFADYVRRQKGSAATTPNPMQQHIDAYAGSWEGHCSGAELLRKTRG